MEFQRIGKNTVQCHMSVEEMQEYGFAIEDFFTDQEKSREFLEQLVERAEEEVGYEVESGMVSMQLMKMPDESLVITFSDRSEEGIQGMMEQLHNLTEMIGEDGELTPEDMENLDAVKKEIAAAREKAGDMMDIIPDAGQEKANKKGASKDTIKEGYAKHAQEMEKKYIEKQKKEKRGLYRIYCPERIKERFFHRASFGYCFWAGLSGTQTDRKRDSLSDIGNFTDRLYGADRILQFK